LKIAKRHGTALEADCGGVSGRRFRVLQLDPLPRAGSMGGDFGLIMANWEKRFPI